MSSKQCYHCGDDVIGKGVIFDDKVFCCGGCKTVYKLLSDSDLGNFYNLENNAGVRPSKSNEHKYAFLEVAELRNKLIDFEDDKTTHVTLYLPKIHCSSCIYLLENLNKLEPGVKSCQVNFAKRTASIVFEKDKVTLSSLSLLLDRIGYAPNYSSKKEIEKKRNYTYLYKLGIAGFAFGSIMLWTFPEYLGIESDNPEFRGFTSYLSFFVSIPVLLYSANEFLIAGFKALKFRSINLDVPISIGIIALYAQSCYNIFNGLGPGYMDSFAGFIFFLLIGKWFQNKTYQSLSFERDYTSYFPVATTRVTDSGDEIVEIDKLQIGDRIRVRNEEIVPCDAQLLSNQTKVDYSFVTGESEYVDKQKGDFVYAGGKLIGNIADFEVKKESSRSHLTQLWNESGVNNIENKQDQSDKVSTFFLAAVLFIAAATGIYYYIEGSDRLTEIVVSVLIVACPCALALSKPFTYGNIMRILGRKGLYLKNTGVIARINDITTVVFDKTGTLTTGSTDNVSFEGQQLSEEELFTILLLANSSTHPLSRAIVNYLKGENLTNFDIEIHKFQEQSGQGVSGTIDDKEIRLGSADFVGFPEKRLDHETSSHVSINRQYVGKFIFSSELRPGIKEMVKTLQNKFSVHVLSGDKFRDRELLASFIQNEEQIKFEQTPKDKKNYIDELQQRNEKILMIGDGLNDAGALESADVGVAVSEDIFRFTPSSDAIIQAAKLNSLNQLLDISKHAKSVLLVCYVFSILYNIVGLSFAITGNLTPLIAAILMPLSSISIVLISTVGSLVKK